MDNRARDRKIIAMRKQGHILGDIALEVNCSHAVVKYVLDTQYLTTAQEKQLRRDNIINLYKRGFTIREICSELGYGPGFVGEVIRQHKKTTDNE